MVGDIFFRQEHREFLVIPKVGKNRKFVGFSWVLVVISQIGKMLPKPKLGLMLPANWDFSVPTLTQEWSFPVPYLSH